jgi:hypothetical protein
MMIKLRFFILFLIFIALIGLETFIKISPLEAFLVAGLIILIFEALFFSYELLINLISQNKKDFSLFKFKNLLLSTKLFSLIATLIGIKIAWYAMLAPISFIEDKEKLKVDLISRKNYLVHKIINSEFGPNSSPGLLNQAFKEEWAIGTLSMLGSALTNLAFQFPELQIEHRNLLKIIIERMLKDDIKVFEVRYWGEEALLTLDGSNGHIGYLGHLNYLIGAYRVLGGGLEFDELHSQISNALARRIKNSPHHFLETFPDQIFIPDNAVVVASLKLFNLTHKNDLFEHEISLWLNYAKEKLQDSDTGLLLPWINAQGVGVGKPRGSYTTWNIFYLIQVDLDFAKNQSELVKKYFFKKLTSNICGIREFVHGHNGIGDIDSGPVIFGLSTAGTGFGLATASLMNDINLQSCLLSTAEIVGTTFALDDKRRYLIAPLIGDAIVLAMRTATHWDDRFLKM